MALLVAATAQAQQFRDLRPLGGKSTPFAFALAVADVDGDGDPDLLLAPWGGPTALDVFVNDAGVLSPLPGAAPQVRPFPDDMAVADVDGDGDIDVAMTDTTANARLLHNDGSGHFTDASQLLSQVGQWIAVAFADVDLDTDPDLIVARNGAGPLLLQNRDGEFLGVPVPLPALAAAALRIRVLDANADGWPDVFVATSGQDALWLNDRGVLRDASANLPADVRVSRDAKAGDIDGDGDVDLVVAGEPHRVWLNDGQGRFTDRPGSFPPDPGSAMSIALGDVDDDGDLDAVVGRWSDRDATLYLNDGTGAFREVPGRLPSDVRAANRHLAFADLDGDSDPDLVVGNQWTGLGRSPATVWYDLHRHAHVAAVPRLGGELRLGLFHRPGYAEVFSLAVPLLGVRGSPLPVGPFGTLHLEPAGMVAKAAVYLPPGAGTGELVLPVPGDPALVGVVVAAQGLVLDPLGGARLTNVTEARIVD
jgi:hypothetical protein